MLPVVSVATTHSGLETPARMPQCVFILSPPGCSVLNEMCLLAIAARRGLQSAQSLIPFGIARSLCSDSSIRRLSHQSTAGKMQTFVKRTSTFSKFRLSSAGFVLKPASQKETREQQALLPFVSYAIVSQIQLGE